MDHHQPASRYQVIPNDFSIWNELVQRKKILFSTPTEEATAVKSEIITSTVSESKCFSDFHQFTGVTFFKSS